MIPLTNEKLLKLWYEITVKALEEKKLSDGEFSEAIIDLLGVFESETIRAVYPDIFDHDDRTGFVD